jgi:hypothetical protein
MSNWLKGFGGKKKKVLAVLENKELGVFREKMA